MVPTTDPNAGKTLSPYGEACLKLWEEGSLQPKLLAYDDGTGTPTIAFGCTVGVYWGMRITPAQAETMFQSEIARFIAAAHRRVTVELDVNEFDSVIIFLYNLGEAAAEPLFDAINEQRWGDVPGIWKQYNKAHKGKGGPLVTNEGLVTRRANELQLWEGTYTDRRIDAAGIPTGAKKPVHEAVRDNKHARGLIASAVVAIAGGVQHGLAYIVHSIQNVVDLVPQVSDNVDRFMGPASSVAKHVGIPWDNIAYSVAAVLVVTTLIGLVMEEQKS